MNAKKLTALVLVGAAGFLGSLFLGYRALTLDDARDSQACLFEEWGEIPNLLGSRWDVEYANCDTLAKDEAVSVYVAEAGDRDFANHRTLLFRYDPGGSGNARPTIEASGVGGILISVGKVSGVSVQRRKWGKLFIDYRIAHNLNP